MREPTLPSVPAAVAAAQALFGASERDLRIALVMALVAAGTSTYEITDQVDELLGVINRDPDAKGADGFLLNTDARMAEVNA